MRFRQEIQGLRALAVVGVILFHFELLGVSGGFVGVDLFFVISGYLMTGIILGKLRQGSFTFNAFYADRARRILPALTVFLLAMLLFGHLALLPLEFTRLGQQTLSALAFVSNFQFWSASGYFDTAARETWLLHTWSLSVEWQFYALYPLFLWGVWRVWGERGLLPGLGGLALLSLAVSIGMTATHPSAAFFLLPSRIWEFLAGGLLLCVEEKNLPWREKLFWPGLGAVLAACFFYTGTQPFPGAAALLPVLGAVAMLFGSTPRPLLTHPVMQHLGDLSYSLYLWHWPLWVGLGFLVEAPHWGHRLGAVLLAYLLALASYAWVERPTRRAPESSRVTFAMLFWQVPLWLVWFIVDFTLDQTTMAALFVSVALWLGITHRLLSPPEQRPMRLSGLLLLGTAVMMSSLLVLHGRLGTQRSEGARRDGAPLEHYRAGICHLSYAQRVTDLDDRCLEEVVEGREGRSTVVIWGDCHGAHLYYGLNQVLSPQGYGVAQVTQGSCLPFLPPRDEVVPPECRSFNAFVAERLARHADKIALVILAPAWSLHTLEEGALLESLRHTVQRLRELGLPAAIVGPFPVWSRSLPELLNWRSMDGREVPRRMWPEQEGFAYGQRLETTLQREFASEYLPTLASLCDDEGCLTTLPDARRTPLQWDKSLLTSQGSEWVARTLLAPRLEPRLPPLGP